MSPSPSRTGWHLTRQGLYWLGIVAVLLLVGTLRNINLVALLGCLLFALFLLQAASAGRGLRSLQVRRWTDDVMHAGAGCRVELRIHNTHTGPLKGLWVEEAGPAHLVGWQVSTLEADGRRALRCEVVPARRGWYELDPVRAASGHPFGLVRVVAEVAPALRLLVLPRPGKIARDKLRRLMRGSDPRGERTRHRGRPHAMARADFHGLRPYRPGDSPRWVHWRTSARRGELMVREFEDVPGDDLVLVFDPAGQPGEVFERAVTLAATLVWEWCQRLGDRLVFALAGPTPEVIEGLTGPDLSRRILSALAAAEAGASSPAAAAAALRPFVPRTAAVLAVSAGPSVLPDALGAALGREATLLDASRPHELDFFTPPPGG